MAPMPTPKVTGNLGGKVPSFAAEAKDLYVSHGKGDGSSDRSMLHGNDSDGYDEQALGNRSVAQHIENSLVALRKQDTSDRLTAAETSQDGRVSPIHLMTPLDASSRKQSMSVPSSPETPVPHLTDSSRSLQEMFEVDDLMASPLLESEVDAVSRDTNAKTKDWYSPGAEHSTGTKNTRHHRTDTPPLSLYAPHFDTNGDKANKVDSDASTPTTSLETSPGDDPRGTIGGSIRGSGSLTGSTAMESVSSSGPSPAARPLLYSAIGSLENLSSTTMGSFNRRVQNAKGRDFYHQSGTVQVSNLLPPQNQVLSQGGPKGRIQASAIHSSLHPSEVSAKNAPTRDSAEKTSRQAKDVAEKGNSFKPRANKTEKDKDDKSSAPSAPPNRISNLKSSRKSSSSARPVTFDPNKPQRISYEKGTVRKKKAKPIEMFRPSCDAYTPRMERKSIAYKPAEMRTPVQKMATPMGTLQRPNFRDALRRVAMIIHQHIVKIERRFDSGATTTSGGTSNNTDEGLFKTSMKETFDETVYVTPTYKCTMVRIPMARPGMVYGLKKLKINQAVPSEAEIYEFAHQLFKKVQLSSECSIVCLIYVERLMEVAKVPLLACTWRPIFMCGLLLASKVWQDLSSWNIEFASVYPQFSLDAINKLELNFLRNVKWDLYISSR